MSWVPRRSTLAVAVALVFAAVLTPAARAAWEPTRPVELIVPSGTGGGGDTMARVFQAIVDKHRLMRQPIVVSNKLSGGGSEGFLELKSARGNPHKLLLASSNLFTTPLGANVAFNWRDVTPVALLALDAFALWVPNAARFRTVGELLEAASGAPAGKRLRMGGTGINGEDRLVTNAIESRSTASFDFIPFRGGGEVALQLAARRIDVSVNNPIEAVDQWHTGVVRPLCIFDATPAGDPDGTEQEREWSAVPTCASQGLAFAYRMMRGLFMAPETGPEEFDFYLSLIEAVRRTPEWQAFAAKGALKPAALTGLDFARWLEVEEARHRDLMRNAGLLAAEN